MWLNSILATCNSMTHRSYNDFHLGDNLIHLHFLRHLALRHPADRFEHAVHRCHMAQLQDAISDVPNVVLVDLETLPCFTFKGSDGNRYTGVGGEEWVNVWKNAGAGTPGGGFWEQHPERNDFAAFYLSWFEYVAFDMGYASPFQYPQDLLFDYPKLKGSLLNRREPLFPTLFDFLVINSKPSSGQFRAYDTEHCMDELILALAVKHSVVYTKPLEDGAKVGFPFAHNLLCTHDAELSITEIGQLSKCCKYIVMVSTGPSWPTFNIFNCETVKFRLVLLDNESLRGLDPRSVQRSNLTAARAELVKGGFL